MSDTSTAYFGKSLCLRAAFGNMKPIDLFVFRSIITFHKAIGTPILSLPDVAKARGMTQIAKETGLGRESLYKALRLGSHPRFETIKTVLQALGVKIVVKSNQA